MENIRIFYKKKDRMKFVSHLDMTRFMTRIIRKAELPIWYTEGFNKHPYINFALPLSLGFESDYEVCDFKITEDLSLENIEQRFKNVLPKGIELIKADYPNFKPKEIKFAEYQINFTEDLIKELSDFLNKDSIIVTKKGKKGKTTEIDLKPHIIKCEIIDCNKNTKLKLILPAGGELNINPSLLINEFVKEKDIPFVIIRKSLLLENFNIFN